MESSFCGPRHVIEIVEAHESDRNGTEKKTRKTWNAEEIEEFQRLTNGRTVTGSIRLWNSTHEKKVILQHCYELKNLTTPHKRGRPFIFTDDEKRTYLLLLLLISTLTVLWNAECV